MRARFFRFLFVVIFSTSLQLSAQTPPGEGDLRRDIAALRDAVIQQTRQIDALTSEVERLGIALGQRRPAAVAPAATPIVQPPVPTATATPVDQPPTVVDSGVTQHTVAKGENLTSIGKKYGTTAEAIQKFNKITDARKLQVGQVINIQTSPTAVVSPTTTPSVKPATPTP